MRLRGPSLDVPEEGFTEPKDSETGDWDSGMMLGGDSVALQFLHKQKGSATRGLCGYVCIRKKGAIGRREFSLIFRK